jgi:Na+-translocating ferredoxin:NAD+ oxidoreductase RnfD subunit
MTPEAARLGALKRFAIAITVLNTFGHTVLGFETSVLQALVSVLTAYAVELVLEAVGAWSQRRAPEFSGGGVGRITIFLLPAHITGLVISMLLYPQDRLLPFVFASTIAIASKAIFTVSIAGKPRHFLNPSNTGLVATILLFPASSIVVPYHFTENLYGAWHWALPALILGTGTFLNTRFTKKMPLIVTWVTAFVFQAVVRHFIYRTWLPGSLAVMTGVAFLLFTFYMITDPATSPASTRGQIEFGASLGVIYGLLIGFNVVFTLFIALFVLCLGRGVVLYAAERGLIRKLHGIPNRWPSIIQSPVLAKVPWWRAGRSTLG